MEALPLGNGSLGAMCYSGALNDVLSVSHSELWSGRPRVIYREGARECYERARELALDGRYGEAHKTLEEGFLTCWSQAFLTFGNISLRYGFDDYENYERRLKLSDALLESSFTSGGKKIKKSTFVSYPDKVLVYKVQSEGGKFSFSVNVDCKLKHSVSVKDGLIVADGECPSDADTYSPHYPCHSLIYSDDDIARGILFRAALKIESDGQIEGTAVKNASYAVIYFTVCTSFNGFDKDPCKDGREYKNACLEIVENAAEQGAETIFKRHASDYKSFYSRVELDLGCDGEDSVPTDKRLENFNGEDNSLYTLLFNFGRYLIISSSREGSQATNLQGIWNDSICPAWNCNYTVNINTEMNYWPVLPSAMPEMTEPLISLMKAAAKNGEVTAREFYGADGFVMHHNTDIWGFTSPVRGSASWGYFPGGSGWLAGQLYDIYEYTLDREKLEKDIFPIMKSAALFYLDLLVEDEDGSLIFCPATSPENSFAGSSVSKSSAIMNSIVEKLFGSCISACETLGIKDGFYDRLTAALPRIKTLKVGEDGRVLEWDEPLNENELHHRHLSHLYALYPARLIDREDTELRDAVRASLEARGDDGTGWSLAWKVCLRASLGEGNRALKLIDRQLRLVPAEANEHTEYGAGERFRTCSARTRRFR